jgi:hypothetical protein
MAFLDVHHGEARSPLLRVLVPSCGALGAAGVVIVGLVTAGVSGWAMALATVPGIAVLSLVGFWSLRRRSAGRIQPRPPAARAARKEHTVRVSFLLAESLDGVVVVDGLAETRPLQPGAPRTPFSLVVRRPRPALADRVVVGFVAECCDNGQDLELVFRGCSRRVLLRSADTEVAVDLTEPARFRLA